MQASQMSEMSQSRSTTTWTRNLARVLLVAAAIALLVSVGRAAHEPLLGFAQWVDGLGAWAPIVFIVGYAIAVVAAVPGSILTLAGGAIFGIALGTVYVLIAATLGASGAFLVARYLARPAVERRIAGNARFAAIDRAVAGQGRRIVFLLRLSPAFPFNLLNYGLGLTRVRFADYFVASLGMLPGTLLYVYYGRLAGEITSVASGQGVERGAGYYAVLALGLVATIVVTTLVTRIARRALDEVTAGEDASGPADAVPERA